MGGSKVQKEENASKQTIKYLIMSIYIRHHTN